MVRSCLTGKFWREFCTCIKKMARFFSRHERAGFPPASKFESNFKFLSNVSLFILFTNPTSYKWDCFSVKVCSDRRARWRVTLTVPDFLPKILAISSTGMSSR